MTPTRWTVPLGATVTLHSRRMCRFAGNVCYNHCYVHLVQLRCCSSSSAPSTPGKGTTSEDWTAILESIASSKDPLADLGPMKLSLTLQSCTRSQLFRSQSGWPTVDRTFAAVVEFLIPDNLEKFNSQDLVLTLKAIERYVKERSYRDGGKGHTTPELSPSRSLSQDPAIQACLNILSMMKGKLSYRTPLRELGMTLSSLVSIDELRDDEDATDIIPHILTCIKEGHSNGSLISSSAKLGEEAYGQGLANLAMALAKLRYEDTAFMEALAGIVCGSIERLSLVDVGQTLPMAPWSVCQIAFAFGKLRIESSEAVPAMFGCIAERVADEEESLSRHLPTACSLLYGMHRLGLECSEFSEMVASRLHPAVGNLDVKQLLLIIPACRRLNTSAGGSVHRSNVNCSHLYHSAGRAFADKAPVLPLGMLIQGCFSIDLSDLENVSQQLRHRGNATWMHHARYGLSIVEALSHNVMETGSQVANPGPETRELVKEICHHYVEDRRILAQITADQKDLLRNLPAPPCFPALAELKYAFEQDPSD